MLIFRLGWLNIWNPIKAEGCMWVNLSRREERQVRSNYIFCIAHCNACIHTFLHTQVFRMLVALRLSEKGENWLESRFRSSVSEEPKVDWKLPDSW